ncbi:MAG: hypothetical protein GX195_09360 [Firmicutes bacterium]|jgi:Mor family transcriptional regulator|nr:hypothetical protein [Bacillota bacterium]
MYFNAEEVLPARLLDEIQQYVQGAALYIPKQGERARWGEKNGTRQQIKQRNLEIAARHRRGESVARLMEEYHLGYDSIKKIVRKYGKERL